ncbi:MAG: GGDEF domain-containing response regulator [Gammaproteobacteria bacterium]|nr:MAG: GGDEF domain-containing response regulator [Gammaproteobacteria bacterium]
MKTENTTHVLLVEDNSTDAYIIESILSDVPDVNYNVQHVQALSDAQDACKVKQPDIILLDLSLSDAHGLATIEELKNAASDSPIVVLTGNKDAETINSAIQAGAQDLLQKGEYNAKFLGKTIHYAIERKQSELELKHLAHFDPLTGIANRLLFIDNMTRAIAHAKRHEEILALMFIDLDDFKNINDTLGHDVGDELLIQVADRLNNVVREYDTVARLGGDEFSIILEDIDSVYNVDATTKKILKELEAPFKLCGQDMFIGASIGIALYPDAGIDTNTLLKNADIAMYQAKNNGKNNYHIFTELNDSESLARIKMESDLQKALSQDEFELYYQPLFDLKTGEIHGAEALLRWNYPERDELVPPIEFIPTLEKTGLIVPIGEWVLRTACLQCKHWHRQGMQDFHVAVNISPRQLQQSESEDWILQILHETGLDGKYLNLEITEDILLDNPEQANINIKRIREMGVAVSVDDFGTGYSSLSYLMNFELDILKIDRSFLSTLATNASTPVILKAIIQMAHGLGLQVVAEGVELSSQYDYLESQGCDMLQGYLFSPPLHPDSLLKFIEDNYSGKAGAVG